MRKYAILTITIVLIVSFLTACGSKTESANSTLQGAETSSTASEQTIPANDTTPAVADSTTQENKTYEEILNDDRLKLPIEEYLKLEEKVHPLYAKETEGWKKLVDPEDTVNYIGDTINTKHSLINHDGDGIISYMDMDFTFKDAFIISKEQLNELYNNSYDDLHLATMDPKREAMMWEIDCKINDIKIEVKNLHKKEQEHYFFSVNPNMVPNMIIKGSSVEHESIYGYLDYSCFKKSLTHVLDNYIESKCGKDSISIGKKLELKEGQLKFYVTAQLENGATIDSNTKIILGNNDTYEHPVTEEKRNEYFKVSYDNLILPYKK